MKDLICSEGIDVNMKSLKENQGLDYKLPWGNVNPTVSQVITFHCRSFISF